jgi:hypothetical protein
LFDVSEADFDGPAGGDLGTGGVQVGGDEEVVGFDPGCVSDDDQPERVGLVDGLPEDVADTDQSLGGSSAHVDLDGLPDLLAGVFGELDWGGQPVAFGAGPAAFAGARRGGCIEWASRRIRDVRWVRGRSAPAMQA